MMNKIFKHLLLISFLSTLFITVLQAEKITWLGGDGYWTDASQWDLGEVPKKGNHVIVPSGRTIIPNGYDVSISSLTTMEGSRVNINQGASLIICDLKDQAAILNDGRINVSGILNIYNIYSPGTTTEAYAIDNRGAFYVYSTGVIDIEGIADRAIYNRNNAYFRSQGVIEIKNITSSAIINSNSAYLRNWGEITISNVSTPSYAYLVHNLGTIRNERAGRITLDADLYGGLTNSGQFYNLGKVEIFNTGFGIYNSGIFRNYNDATLAIIDVSTCVQNSRTANFRNDGDIEFTSSGSGLNNLGLFNNYNSIVIVNNTRGLGRNHAGGRLYNHGYISVYNVGYGPDSFYNLGLFVNEVEGTLEVFRKIRTGNNSETINDGIIWTYYHLANDINGSFENHGVIDDNYGDLQGRVDNRSAIVAPIEEPLYVNVTLENVLDFYEYYPPLNFTIESSWYSSPSGNILVGEYNVAYNTFVPNQNAVGLNTVYFRMLNNITGVWRYYSLELTEGISASPSSFIQNPLAEIKPEISTSTVAVFPNPTSGQVQLESKLWMEQDAQIEVYNTIGELMQSSTIEAGSNTNRLDLSSQLSDGIYVLRVLQGGKIVATERLNLQRY